jgi:hypothetical protein
MKIPSHELADIITVKPHTGHSALGPVYGTPYTIHARVEPYQDRVLNERGDEVLVNAQMLCAADCILRVPDAVTWDGQLYEVVRVEAIRERLHVHHVEVLMASIAGEP